MKNIQIEPLKPYLISGPLVTGAAWAMQERLGFSAHKFTNQTWPMTTDKPVLVVSTFERQRVRMFYGAYPTRSQIEWLVQIGEELLRQNLIYSYAVIPENILELPKVSGEFEDLITKRLCHAVSLESIKIDQEGFDRIEDEPE